VLVGGTERQNYTKKYGTKERIPKIIPNTPKKEFALLR
jgi:hypothetical protein